MEYKACSKILLSARIWHANATIISASFNKHVSLGCQCMRVYVKQLSVISICHALDVPFEPLKHRETD